MNKFYPVAGMVALSAVTTACQQADKQEKKQYNIVYIMTDDHTAQMMSCYDTRYMETPNLDRIANEGVRFTNSFVANSLSGPSRACMITGKHSCGNKFYDNTTCVFDSAQQTFPKLLQKAGYQTAIIGKWHLESLPSGFDYWQREHIIKTEKIQLQDNHGKEVEHFCDVILDGAEPVTTAEEILKARKIVNEVYLDEKIEQYIADIVFASRYPDRYGLPELKNMITFGGSPRASINLAKASRAYAFIKHRGYVVPEDVRAVAHDVMRHRIGLSYEAEASNTSAEEIVSKIINKVEVP